MDTTQPKTPEAIELECPVKTWILPIIRRLAVGVAEHMGFSQEDVHKIEICVDEACANVVEHAYSELDSEERKRHVIRVRIIPRPERLQVHIVDYGTGRPERYGTVGGVTTIEEYLKEDRPKGLGTFIMGRLMDEVTFNFPPDCGTEVTLVKNLNL